MARRRRTSFQVNLPLRQFGSGRVAVDTRRGKASATEFQVLQRSAALSLLDAHPITGRRHQIRVHLFSAGHPVAGDPLYGEQAMQASFPRLMLHSRSITFSALGGNRVTVISSTPPSFEEVLRIAGFSPSP